MDLLLELMMGVFDERYDIIAEVAMISSRKKLAMVCVVRPEEFNRMDS